MLCDSQSASICHTADDMGRQRLEQRGNLYGQGGWWRLRWMEDVINGTGAVAQKWSRPAWIGPSTGKQRLTEKEARRIAWENFLSKLSRNNVVPQSIITLNGFVDNHFQPEHVALNKPASRLFDTSQF